MQNFTSIPRRPRAHSTLWGPVLLFAAGLSGCAGQPAVRTPPPIVAPLPIPAGPPLLGAGETVERDLSPTETPGDPEAFRLAAEAGWFLSLEVESGTPVLVRILTPSGREQARGETRRGLSVPLRLAVLAAEAGEQRIEIAPVPPSAGVRPYRLVVRQLRPARPGDGQRLPAEAALAEARRLARQEDEPSLKLAEEQGSHARQLFETAQDPEGRSRALLELAELRLRLGAPAEARELAQEALKGTEDCGEGGGPGERAERADCRGRAQALSLLGAAALAGGGPSEGAREPLERALPLWRGCERPAAPGAAAGTGRTLYLLALEAAAREPERASTLLREALEPLRRSGDGEGEALAEAALEPLLTAQGQGEEGRRTLDQALALSRDGGHRAAEARILAQRAALRRQAGDPAGARADYRSAAELLGQLGRRGAGLALTFDHCALLRDQGEDEESRLCWAQAADESLKLADRGLETEAQTELAEVALRQGRPKDALALLDRAALPLRALPEERRRALLPRTTRDAGLAKRNAGRPRDALADLQMALDLLEERGSPRERAQTLIVLGLTRQSLGDLPEAADAFSRAGELASGVGLEGERRWSLFGLASVAFAQKDLDQARAGIQGALALDAGAPLVPWERALAPGESRRHLFYELQVELLMRQHFRDPGAGFAALAFEASVAARGPSIAAGPGGTPAPAPLAPAAPPVSPASLAEVERGLAESEALLHYFVGQERSYLFVVTRAGLRPFEVPIRARELAARIQRLRSTLAQPQSTPRPLLMEAVPLFEVLLAPALGSLQGVRHLIVSAEGPLLTLPFEVLPTGAKVSRGRGFADLPYLLRERALSYRPLPSPSPVPAVPGDPPAPEGALTLLAFAAPLPRGSAPPAAHAREEVEEIAGRVPKEGVEVVLGAEATERRALADRSLPSARRIHFAAFGLLDSIQPARSALALTPEGADDDGLLDAGAIARLRLAAELVALPLCRTVRGREVGGEGGYTLARAFLQAGAREVLLGLWPVPDAAASNLLPKLYELLDAGEAPAEALRAAKLSLLESGAADPLYWAPFVLLDGPPTASPAAALSP